MNFAIVQRLIFKDWYLQRGPILVSLAGSVISVAIIALGGQVGFYLGLIGLITVLVGFGANLAIATTVNERKEQTLPFIMSLPVSNREYTAAKILANLLLFLTLWATITTVSIVLLLISPEYKMGLIPYVAIMATEMLVSTCLIATVALITESQRWTIGFIMVGNLAINGFGYFVAHIPSIARTMFGPSLQWNATSVGILLAEFATIGLLLILSFVVQSRKRDFL